MANLWPWLAIAATGALHRLNPASGWLLAAACSVRSPEQAQALRMLLPMGLGQVASVALVAGAVTAGVAIDRAVLQAVAGGLLLVVASLHFRRRAAPRVATDGGRHAALALGSFLMSTAHGTGLMLVPALVPLCGVGAAAGSLGASGPLTVALAAISVHAAAMLASTGLVSTAAFFGIARLRRALGCHAVLPVITAGRAG